MAICHLVGAMGGDLRPELAPGDLVLGVDGGLATLEAWGLEPDLALGDFDSLGYVPTGEKVIRLPVEKDDTDMAYGLKLGESRGFRHFLLQGGLGGRLDHSLANLQLLLGLARRGSRGILLGEGQNLTVLAPGTWVFPPTVTGICSVFALGGPAEGVSLANLAYELEGATLTPDVPLGVSNEFLSGKPAKIAHEGGYLALVWQGLGTSLEYRNLLENNV